MLLLISYDLHAPGRDYEPLIEEIKKAGSWCHLHESAWIIDTRDSPETWVDRLTPRVDRNDEIFVVRLARNWWSVRLAPEKVEWLKDPRRTW